MIHTRMIISTVVIIAMLFAGTELWVRQKVRQINQADSKIVNILFYSGPIIRQPNKDLSFRLYGLNAELIFSADFHLNNMGFISKRDYQHERRPKQFRIVVIGGEQTASSVADQSWPDVLEDELNRRDHSIEYKVYNVAWPDAGPEHYLKYWKEEGSKFNPDLVVVNYVETDFYRTISGAPHTIKGYPIGHSTISYRVGPGEDDVAKVITANIQGRDVTSFRDPSAVPGRPYGFFAMQTFLNDRERVRGLQSQVANDMIEGALPCFGCLTLRVLQGKSPIIHVERERNFDPLPDQPLDRKKMVQFGVTNFGGMVDSVKNLIITHNFYYHEMDVPFEFTAAMTAAAPKIKVLDMRKRIPASVSDEERYTWYLMPHMIEKWSNKGHDVYGKMMADVVLDWRAKRLKWDGE